MSSFKVTNKTAKSNPSLVLGSHPTPFLLKTHIEKLKFLALSKIT